MARIRSIKPGFFTNEHLAELGPWHRLCFAGLWVLADREGRLEDRPRRIKAALFPYDDIDAGALLTDLERAGFIARYDADGVSCVQIIQFHKHQRPKKDEHASVLPAMVLDDSRGIRAVPRVGNWDMGTVGHEDTGDSADAAAPGADGAQAFMDLWNATTEPPIARCRELSSTRKRSVKIRLTERPLTEWAEVFARIQGSAFCRGENDRGWRASFDWVIGSPDVAVKVLEGKYDNHAGREAPFSATERATAERLRKLWMQCPHDPGCESYAACVQTIMREQRQKAKTA